MKKQLAVVLISLTCALVVNGQGNTQRSPVPSTSLPVTPAQPRPAVSPYWDPNRKLNLNGPAKGDRRFTTKEDFKFRIAADTRVRDALGRDLGTIQSGSHVQINKGAQRIIVGPNGERHVYELVLGARLTNPSGGPPIYGSGFVERKKIDASDRPRLQLPKAPNVHGPTTAYSLTGGNPKDKTLGYFEQGKFIPYKFRDRKTGRGYTDPHRESTDYVARPLAGQKYVNILNKLPGKGGTAVSVIAVDRKKPVNFHVLKDVAPKTVDLYKPGGKKAGSMTFVKGYVNDPKTNQKVVGWAAKKALDPKPTAAAKKKSKH